MKSIPRRMLTLEQHVWETKLHGTAAPPSSPGQMMEPPIVSYDNKAMAIIMGIVIVVFFVSGFISMYSRQCGNRRRFRGHIDLNFPIGLGLSGSRAPGRGVDPEIIQTFPTFAYSSVKGRSALACSVCLNEYEDDDTLRLIPRCRHVFHPECIDSWLKSHYTCPLCRANLLIPFAPQGESEDETTPFVGMELPEEEEESENREGRVNNNNNIMRSRTVKEEGGGIRSRSTGYLMGILFGRSRSLGDHHGNNNVNWERYTLRLEEVRRGIGIGLNRTRSCVTFTRMSSGRRGYRTRSVGSSQSQLRYSYDRFFPVSHTIPFTP